MCKITESDSNYDKLEQMTTNQLLYNINKEDKTIAESVEKVIPSIQELVEVIVPKMKLGGRLFYIGAGTSGRLGILDASECPPTFGVNHGLVIGIIAGGDTAIRKAVEFAEDDENLGWDDLQNYGIDKKDVLIGIAASGTTPYVVGALSRAKDSGITTGCITCNTDSPLSKYADYPISVIVGPEFITGSTRMKSGTAQKLILNMLSTTIMVRLGRVRGNKMVDMQLSNSKLVERGVNMIVNATGINQRDALILLNQYGSVRKAIDNSNG